MSYDLHIWSVKQADINALITKYNLKRSGDDFYHEARTWQIVINPQSEVLEEDIPDHIMGLLPGIKYMMEINVEPISAPRIAITLAKKISDDIAKLTVGVVVNDQEDTIMTPKGIKRFIESQKLPKMDIVVLSWWMNHDLLTQPDRLQKFIGIIESHLPEALPRRYGSSEPPQFKYDSKEAFVNFLAPDNVAKVFVVWYPNTPVMNVDFSVPPAAGPIVWGGKPSYRSSHISVSVDATVLTAEGWPLALRRFFKEMSLFLKPFYGDIRVLHNFYRRGRSYLCGADTEDHPIKSWWWRGIPKKLGLAMILGDPLLQHLPDFINYSEQVGELRLADSFYDGRYHDLKQELFEIPRGLIQPPEASFDSFPEIWPFEPPKEL